MEVYQRDVWWANLPNPSGSEAGFRRPIIVVQRDSINLTRLSTYLAIPLSGALRRQEVIWNLLLRAEETGLPHDSVAQPTGLFAADQRHLIEKTGQISERRLNQIFERLDMILGRDRP